MNESRNFLQTTISFDPPTSKRSKVSIEEKVDRVKPYSQTVSVNRLSDWNTMPPISPPSFSRISLLYPEDEIWTRLQIREFLYQFGSVCQMEPRLITSLQNVQDNWRIRRLSTLILWQALQMIGECVKPKKNPNSDESNTKISNEPCSLYKPSVQTQARRTINAWGSELCGITSTRNKEKLDRIGDVLVSKGMTARRWQDVAELLALADFKNLPVPTLAESEDDDDDDETDQEDEDEDEDEDMEEDSEYSTDSDEEDIDIEVRKFRALKRSPLSTKEELQLVQMVLDLLLQDGKIRKHISDTAKNTRTLEEELRNIKKTSEAESFRYYSMQHQLLGQIDQAKGKKDKANIQLQLKEQDISFNLQQTNFHQSALETLSSLLRSSNRRLHHLITPWDGNEYWMFNDLLTPQQHKDVTQSGDLYWAHGVIVIGHAPKQDKTKRRWWHISGIANLQSLDKWMVNNFYTYNQPGRLDPHTFNALESELVDFRTHLTQRMDYLWLLEHTIYEPDHFT